MYYLSRRDLLRWGIASGGAAALAGALRNSRGDSLPSSPPTTPFVLELLPGRGIPPVKQTVAPFPTLRDTQAIP